MSAVASSSSAPAPKNTALEAANYRRLHPRAYLSKFLEEGVRPDGRGLDEFREVSINPGAVSTANGSALVRMGDTTIVCGIKAEIAEPDWERPNEGFIVPNLDLPALCSPQFKPGPPSDEAQIYSQQLSDLLTSTGVLPTTSLLIHPGKAAWVLYIDAVCINYDAGGLDCLVLAVMAALRNTRLPVAKYDTETGQTICSRTETVPLGLVDSVHCFTFGVYDNKHLLPDPTSSELPLCSTTLTIALSPSISSSSSPRIRLIRQLGLGGLPMAPGGPDGAGVLGEAIAAARGRLGVVEGALGGV